MSIRRIAALFALLLMGGVAGLLAWLRLRVPREAPPRVADRVVVPPQTLIIAVPISAPRGELSNALEDAIPRQLWTIDQPGQVCVASRRIDRLLSNKGSSLTEKHIGEFVPRAHVDDVRTGALKATGQGVYLAVTGKGTATITLDLPAGERIPGRGAAARLCRARDLEVALAL